jgi:hypothetical protein
MYKIVDNGSVSNGYALNIIADKLSDFEDENFPRAAQGAGVGSQVVCLEDSNLYVLGNDDEYHLFR